MALTFSNSLMFGRLTLMVLTLALVLQISPFCGAAVAATPALAAQTTDCHGDRPVQVPEKSHAPDTTCAVSCVALDQSVSEALPISVASLTRVRTSFQPLHSLAIAPDAPPPRAM